MKHLFNALLAIILISCTEQQRIPEYAEKVDNVFSDWKPTEPGAAIGIYRGGKLEYAKGYGMANMDYGIANTTNSVFRIASTSKQFTAACIILLAEQGQLSLDNPLSKFFPEFPDYAKDISLRHLLNHTSGIRDYLQLVYLAGFDDDDFYTDEEVMNLLVKQKNLNFATGDEFLYSNSGYWLLGQVVLKVSGTTLAEFAEQNIFKPLQMKNTHFHDNNSMIVPNRASGYTPTDDGFEIIMTQLEMIGDGGVFTTIEDLGKWVDNFSTHTVGSQEFTQKMQTKAILNNGDTLDYALGLNITKYNDKPVVRHGGAFVGYRAELMRFPEENIAIAVLTNRSDGQAGQHANQIADVLFDKPKTSVDKIEPQKTSEDYVTTPEKLAHYVGSYWNDTLMKGNKVSIKNDTLYLDNNRLVAIESGQFSLVKYPKIKVSFRDDRMTIQFPGRDPQIYTAYELPIYTASDLNTFAGSYYSEELQVSYLLQLQGKELLLYINGKKISPLVSGKENIFVNDAMGTFEFIRTKNKSTGFILTSGRVKNLLFKKE